MSTTVATIHEGVGSYAFLLLGTEVEPYAPLMDAGLDSAATTEFANMLSECKSLNVSSVALFDHPTIESITSYLLA